MLPVNPMEREGERREKEKTRNAVHLLSRPCALYHAGQHITVECEHVQKERKQTWNLFGPLPLTMLPWKSMFVYESVLFIYIQIESYIQVITIYTLSQIRIVKSD